MIEDRPNEKDGDVFDIGEYDDKAQIIRYQRFEDGLWKMLTPNICAFLNNYGGIIVVGVTSGDVIRSIPLTQKQIDSIGLRFDSHINGLSPQVDARNVSATFVRVQRSAHNTDEKTDNYVTVFRILPGTKPLYYTSFLFKQSFTISQTGPRTLNREEIRMRNQNSREFCIQLEQFNHSENVFVDNYHKIEQFLEGERDTVKIIQISGNQGSGRQTLVELTIEKLFQNCTVVQIDFDCIKNFEDFYIHLLKQFDWKITRQTERDLKLLSDEHKTFKKPWET